MQKKSTISNARRVILARAVGKRREEMLDQVRAVAQGYTTALFVYGPGGLGKTHYITEELDGLCDQGWLHHTAYSTPKALFQSLYAAPAAIHLFEDCEKLYKVDVASSILRAACGAPRGGERRITYETANESLTCRFTGGIIIVSNESLERHASGPLKAVASRFRPIKWDMNTEERMGAILDLADTLDDRRGMLVSKADRREIAAWLIDKMSGNGAIKVDLRTFVEHCIPAFAQWQNGDSVSNWRDILDAKLSGDVSQGMSREDAERHWEDLAIQIDCNDGLKGTAEKVGFWKEHTEMGQAQYYRYLKNAKSKRQIAIVPKKK